MEGVRRPVVRQQPGRLQGQDVPGVDAAAAIAGTASEMTGPWRVARMVIGTGWPPRTRIVSWRTAKGRGPSGVW